MTQDTHTGKTPAHSYLVGGTDSDGGIHVLGVFEHKDEADQFSMDLLAYTAAGARYLEPEDAEDRSRFQQCIAGHPVGEAGTQCRHFFVSPVVRRGRRDQGGPLLGYANARDMQRYRDGVSTSVQVVRDEATLWRTRHRDGTPVPVYLRRGEI